MAKESSKVQQNLTNVLNVIDAHKKTKGSLPEVLECDPEVFGHLHAAVMQPVEDAKLKKLVTDNGLKVKVDHLSRIRVAAGKAVAVF